MDGSSGLEGTPSDLKYSYLGRSVSPVMYLHLQQVARRMMRRERRSHTYRPTELVNEALIRVVDKEFNDRSHFYATLALGMRHILVDHAKARLRAKRSIDAKENYQRVLESVEEATPDKVVQVDELLSQFQTMDPQAARIFELVYFAGLTTTETASVLRTSLRTVARKLRFAKAWFIHKLSASIT